MASRPRWVPKPPIHTPFFAKSCAYPWFLAVEHQAVLDEQIVDLLGVLQPLDTGRKISRRTGLRLTGQYQHCGNDHAAGPHPGQLPGPAAPMPCVCHAKKYPLVWLTAFVPVAFDWQRIATGPAVVLLASGQFPSLH